jgi:hypothetical protein
VGAEADLSLGNQLEDIQDSWSEDPLRAILSGLLAQVRPTSACLPLDGLIGGLMTLVVGRETAYGFDLVADSRLTLRQDRGHSGFVNDALKIVIINPTSCVGFAGDPLEAVESIRAAAKSSHDDVVDGLVQALCSSTKGDRVGFLVSTCRPDPALFKIENGQVRREKSSAWIGCRDAFNAFQRYRLEVAFKWRDSMDDPVATYILQMQAMRRVIEDDSIKCVGNLVVGTLAQPEGYRYPPLLIGHAGRDPARRSVKFTTTRLGRARQLSPSTLVPTEPGIGVVGLFIEEGCLGVLFHPLQIDKPKIYHDVDYDSFRKAVKNDFRVQLVGGKRVD